MIICFPFKGVSKSSNFSTPQSRYISSQASLFLFAHKIFSGFFSGILSTKFQSWKKTKCWRGGKKRVAPYVFPRGNSILGRIRFQNPRQQAPSVRFQNRTYVRPGYQPWRPRQPQEPFYLDPTWN